jgi:acetyl esterase/lipase
MKVLLCLNCLVIEGLFLAGFATRATAAEPALGVVYAVKDGKQLALDVAVPDDPGPHPLLVYIHGGGWRSGSRDIFRPVLQQIAQRGYVAASLSYRLAPQHTWPAQIDDVEDAVRWLRSNAEKYKIDVHRVGALGLSAGGHLALMLGLRPRNGADDAGVDVVVNYFGPTDLTSPAFLGKAKNVASVLIGKKGQEDPKAYASASPLTYVSRGGSPILTFHGSEDKLVPATQAQRLHRALDEAGIPNRLELLEGLGHGWGGDDQKRTSQQAQEFLDAYLKGSDLPLLLSEDFATGAEGWQPTDPTAWKVANAGGRTFYSIVKKKHDYEPPVRSPSNFALRRDLEVTDFVLEVRLQSTEKDYGHRDLCLFFGHQDAAHFYYVHLGKEADSHAHSIFLVNGKPRVSIAEKRTQGIDWDDQWHRVRLKREVESGQIEVYFDDMVNPVLTAHDKTFLHGRIGIGSFDDTGNFTEVRLRGTRRAGR